MNKKGASIAQYGIVIALIALAVVPIYFTMGSYITKCLTDFYVSLGGNSNNQTTSSSTVTTTGNSPTTNSTTVSDQAITNGSVLAGQLGGTSDKPIQKCAGSVCAIDYGEFILNGIPTDFGGFVQSSGTSGGTDQLLAILDQLANNTSLPSNSTGLLKKLSNEGHMLANNQKAVEKAASSISGSSYSDWSKTGYSALEETNELDNQYGMVLDALQNSTNPADKNIKDVVSILVGEIQLMNKNLVKQCTTVNEVVENLKTGASTSALSLDNAAYNLLHPSTSERTDMDSAIICKTGNGKDNGVKCK